MWGHSNLKQIDVFHCSLYTLKPIFHCDAKPFALDPGVNFDSQHHNFALPIPTCWYLKTLKFTLPPTLNIKFALPPTPTPNASQWNIGCVRVPNAKFSRWQCTFLFFVLISFAFGGQRKPSFQWNMGFKRIRKVHNGTYCETENAELLGQPCKWEIKQTLLHCIQLIEKMTGVNINLYGSPTFLTILMGWE